MDRKLRHGNHKRRQVILANVIKCLEVYSSALFSLSWDFERVSFGDSHITRKRDETLKRI